MQGISKANDRSVPYFSPTAFFSSGFDGCNAAANILLYFRPPESEHKPPLCFQGLVNQPIAAPISLDFAMPKFNVGFMFQLALIPVLSMPKLAISENSDIQRPKSKVRLSKDPPVILAIPETCPP